MSTTIDEDTYAGLDIAVQDGAEFMDAVDAGRYWIVDPETLDIARFDRCVLGQHSGDYRPEWYGIDYSVGNEPWDFAFSGLGFGFPSTQWLNALWREQIWDRRAAYFERTEQAS